MTCVECYWFYMQIEKHNEDLPKCYCFHHVWEMRQGENEIQFREYIKKAENCCEYKIDE